MTATTFLLVRHAHASWRPDEMRPLSPRGRRQAEAVARRLLLEKPTAIYSSPYLRARQTAEPLALEVGLTIQESADLRERSLGHQRVEDWQATIRPTWEDFSLAYPAGGETNAEAMKRARRVFTILRHRHLGETIVLVTHGNLLVLLLRLLDESKGFDFWRALRMPDLFRWVVTPDSHHRLERLEIPS